LPAGDRLAVPELVGPLPNPVQRRGIVSPDPTRIIRMGTDPADQSPTIDSGGALRADDFSDAIALADRYEVSVIEITVPVLRVKPTVIKTARPLIIRSTCGGTLLRSEPAESTDNAETAWITIQTNQLQFEDLHFLWNEQSATDQISAMFAIRGNRRLAMNRCSITVDGSPTSNRKFGFRVTGPEPWNLFGIPLKLTTTGQRAQLDLDETIVRGSMTMISVDPRADLKLTWNEGLLTVTDRLIDVIETTNQVARDRSHSMELELTRVTAHAAQGLLRVPASARAVQPFFVDWLATESLFVVDPPAPFFEFRGLPGSIDPSAWLRVRGRSNAYSGYPDDRREMLRLESVAGDTQVTQVRELRLAAPGWFADRDSQWITEPPFRSPVQVKPAARTVDLYERMGGTTAGFSPQRMPAIPDNGASPSNRKNPPEKSDVKAPNFDPDLTITP
jgi:hypothetical protein